MSLLDAGRIVGLARCDPGDHECHTGRFGPCVLPILEVQVMNDLRELAQGWIMPAKSFHECFERAPLTLVAKVRLGHVEAQLAGIQRLGRSDEAELRFVIDEPPNEPRARDAIDENSSARHPRATLIRRNTRCEDPAVRPDVFGWRRPRRGWVPRCALELLPQAGKARVRRLPARGAEPRAARQGTFEGPDVL